MLLSSNAAWLKTMGPYMKKSVEINDTYKPVQVSYDLMYEEEIDLLDLFNRIKEFKKENNLNDDQIWVKVDTGYGTGSYDGIRLMAYKFFNIIDGKKEENRLAKLKANQQMDKQKEYRRRQFEELKKEFGSEAHAD
jgi:hypothetical protein